MAPCKMLQAKDQRIKKVANEQLWWFQDVLDSYLCMSRKTEISMKRKENATTFFFSLILQLSKSTPCACQGKCINGFKALATKKRTH